MKQEIIFGMVDFKLSALRKYELTKQDEKYTPLIISINYGEKGQNYAFIHYCVFTMDTQNQVSGMRSTRQLVLVNGMPF